NTGRDYSTCHERTTDSASRQVCTRTETRDVRHREEARAEGYHSIGVVNRANGVRLPEGLTPFPEGLTPFPDGLTPRPSRQSPRSAAPTARRARSPAHRAARPRAR